MSTLPDEFKCYNYLFNNILSCERIQKANKVLTCALWRGGSLVVVVVIVSVGCVSQRQRRPVTPKRGAPLLRRVSWGCSWKIATAEMFLLIITPVEPTIERIRYFTTYNCNP